MSGVTEAPSIPRAVNVLNVAAISDGVRFSLSPLPKYKDGIRSFVSCGFAIASDVIAASCWKAQARILDNPRIFSNGRLSPFSSLAVSMNEDSASPIHIPLIGIAFISCAPRDLKNALDASVLIMAVARLCRFCSLLGVISFTVSTSLPYLDEKIDVDFRLASALADALTRAVAFCSSVSSFLVTENLILSFLGSYSPLFPIADFSCDEL